MQASDVVFACGPAVTAVQSSRLGVGDSRTGLVPQPFLLIVFR